MLAAVNCLRMPEAIRFQESRMSGNPLVRFDEGRVGRSFHFFFYPCRPLSYSTETSFRAKFQSESRKGAKSAKSR
jgi:hypothetical protein